MISTNVPEVEREHENKEEGKDIHRKGKGWSKKEACGETAISIIPKNLYLLLRIIIITKKVYFSHKT